MNTSNTIFDRNQPFNQLPSLPPSDLHLDQEILLKWGLASRRLAELNKNILRLPNPGMMVNTISIQEAKSSTAIENIFTTEDELYKAISDNVKEESASPNVKEVLRYRESLWAGYQSILKKGLIDLDVIVNIYQQIKNTQQEIRPPQAQVVIKRGNSEFRPGETIYTPPRGTGILEGKMTNLIEYLRSQQHDEMDPLLKMAVAHYQFETIHPFSDGNGRTGRIINLLYLINQGLISHPVLYLSRYIINNKNEYYFALEGVTQRRDWKTWIVYMMTAVENTSIHTNRLIDQINDQMQASLEHGKKRLKWYNKEINEALFYQPYCKPITIANILGRTSRTTLSKYFSQLTEMKLLNVIKEGKDVYYVNADLVRILSD